jgi:pimeloyl-ACP methyl ester carboxylesterase
MYVDVARRLAEEGFHVFRFDVSGMGDSEVSKDMLGRQERITADIREALDLLENKKNISNFVLMGLCSGADNAHTVALIEPRVVGMVLLDGYSYSTTRFYIRQILFHYSRRMMDISKWNIVIKRMYEKAKTILYWRGDQSTEQFVFTRKFPPKDELKKELCALISRGVRLFFIYTGGIGYYNYKNQFKDSFQDCNFGDQLELEYFPDSDHMYTLKSDREKLIKRIVAWMRHTYLP